MGEGTMMHAIMFTFGYGGLLVFAFWLGWRLG
jgi:hypothetical protein